MKFGAHISTAAPFSAAIERARETGCECMQIFLNAPQRWNTVEIPEEEINRFVELNHNPHPRPLPKGEGEKKVALLKGEGENGAALPKGEGDGHDSFPLGGKVGMRAMIDPIISHSIYLISLAGLNPFYYEASKKSLIDEMEKGKKLGLFGVNTHLGSSKEKSFNEVKDSVVSAINEVIEAVPDGPYFIIENSAGAGNIIGDRFEEIGEIIRGIQDRSSSVIPAPRDPRLRVEAGIQDRVKVILDTAHMFESGYPIHTKDGLEETIDQFDKEVGLERLVGLHLNDSLTPFNSKRDRHADIGQGEIGIEAFERIVNHPKLRDLFGIIETPSMKGKGGVDNLAILRGLSK